MPHPPTPCCMVQICWTPLAGLAGWAGRALHHLNGQPPPAASFLNRCRPSCGECKSLRRESSAQARSIFIPPPRRMLTPGARSISFMILPPSFEPLPNPVQGTRQKAGGRRQKSSTSHREEPFTLHLSPLKPSPDSGTTPVRSGAIGASHPPRPKNSTIVWSGSESPSGQ